MGKNRMTRLRDGLSDAQCWRYIFTAFGGEARTPPAVDRHPELVEAVRQAYRDGCALNAAAPDEVAETTRLQSKLAAQEALTSELADVLQRYVHQDRSQDELGRSELCKTNLYRAAIAALAKAWR